MSANEAETSFSRLGLEYSFDGQDLYTITVPSFRHDINEEVDLIEEIGRLAGLERESTKSPHYSTSKLSHHPLYLFEGEVQRRLLSFGLQEAINSDLISPEQARLVMDHSITEDSLVKMLNPLSSEQSILRPSLMPGLLEAVRRNLNQRILDLHFFEIGHAHLRKGEGFVEPRIFAIMLSGKAKRPHFLETGREWDFFDLKGMLEELFFTLGFSEMCVKKSELSMFHPGRQAKVYVGDVHVGVLGEIHPELLAKLDIPQRVLFAECDMQELLNLPRKERKMQEMAIYPSSERDWTHTVSKQLPIGHILEKIREGRPQILESVSLVSIFQHEKLGEERQNVTFRFIYRDKAKTVQQEEVEAAHQKLVTTLAHYLQEKYPV